MSIKIRFPDEIFNKKKKKSKAERQIRKVESLESLPTRPERTKAESARLSTDKSQGDAGALPPGPSGKQGTGRRQAESSGRASSGENGLSSVLCCLFLLAGLVLGCVGRMKNDWVPQWSGQTPLGSSAPGPLLCKESWVMVQSDGKLLLGSHSQPSYQSPAR